MRGPVIFALVVFFVGATSLLSALVIRVAVTRQQRWKVPCAVRMLFLIGFPCLAFFGGSGLYMVLTSGTGKTDSGAVPCFSGIVAFEFALLARGVHGEANENDDH